MQFFQNIVLRLSDKQIDFFKNKVEQITSLEREAANPDTPRALKENLMYSSTLKKMDMIMDFVIDHVRSNGQNYSNKINKSFFKMFVDFIELVEMHCCVNHFVDFYAQQLNVSARRLLECIKNFSGKTPSQWINDILISKIKVDLILNQKTVCQMVDDYGFSDTSALYKYFRNATGMSPKQFQITNMIDENKE
jgi:AraC-like DNA-binding protein